MVTEARRQKGSLRLDTTIDLALTRPPHPQQVPGNGPRGPPWIQTQNDATKKAAWDREILEGTAVLQLHLPWPFNVIAFASHRGTSAA